MSTSPLSVGQEALRFLHDLAPDSAAYNVAFAFGIRDEIDLDALAAAVRLTARRHDMLRSSFDDARGRVVHDDVVRLDVRRVDDEVLTDLVSAVITEPFRLREAPLIRFVLLVGPNETVFVMVAHHAVVDAGSQTVILRDLFAFYRSGADTELPELPATFADHVRAEIAVLESPRRAELVAYWRQAVAGAPFTLDLPTDRPRPPVQRYRGAAMLTRVPDDVVADLRAAARGVRVTPFVFLVTAFQLLLHRYSGQDDFLLGCVLSTKDRRMANVVGNFANPVLLRPRVGRATTFRELAEETSRQLRYATAHRDLPFALLPAELGVPQDRSRSALFQVVVSAYLAGGEDTLLDELFRGSTDFEYQGVRVAATTMPPQQTGQFDLTLELHMSRGAVGTVLKYSTDLFDESTIRRMAGHYHALLASAAADPDGVAARLSMVDGAERAELIAASAGATGEPLDW
ncbi:hypothetical protein GCM10022243_14170 [Saccharothrix violaceirubra]|uniref:Condensation domain-containing protein n=1 Tax=Saccharothrix violaceirubra TaxID=413306 RepID=A0A7W7WXP4_9PSEU|nr:condensation domain-containing protein [Saccharothrix violaceirubra]MBB4967291.1 hypothetical protein [Saccharothrix violaceirubra]